MLQLSIRSLFPEHPFENSERTNTLLYYVINYIFYQGKLIIQVALDSPLSLSLIFVVARVGQIYMLAVTLALLFVTKFPPSPQSPTPKSSLSSPPYFHL